MKTVFILNGPNLNLLGQRQPEIYGRETLSDVEQACAAEARALGLGLDFRQSNHEGVLVEMIHEARHSAAGIIINAGAYTHTSVAILDALNAFDGPVIEVHISNIHRREAFRHHSYISARADAMIAGCGTQG
ncbi:type II 3-dehydroquinate dehydratase, partial [Klebsiella michiganensis]|uniref:type II 3-dehydroquinate dehydratase n=1 Tax=Klebsiella michiganensis TaxID=1134687 RepID=UPI00259FF640